MVNSKVSVVIPVYKPDMEILERLRNVLKKQTIKSEIIEKWNNPEAVSMNLGIKESKGEFVIILAQDCIPENEKWVEKMIAPLKDKTISAVVSDLILPENYWKKRPFFVRWFTINDLKLRKPLMNLSSCAYRKKDLENMGYISEKMSAIDLDAYLKLNKMGKIVRGNTVTYHLHPHNNYRKMLKTFYNYSKFNGISVRNMGFKEPSFCQKLVRATPLLGIISIYLRYPAKKYFYLIPFHFFLGALMEHFINVVGFWHGFFFAQEDGERNKEVLKETDNLP